MENSLELSQNSQNTGKIRNKHLQDGRSDTYKLLSITDLSADDYEYKICLFKTYYFAYFDHSCDSSYFP